MTTTCFVDTETTSLRHDRRIWEIGLIVRGDHTDTQADREWSWLIQPNDLDLGNADPMSLKIGRFYERHPSGANPSLFPGDVETERFALAQVEALTRGATIVGAVPNFDTEVLANRMRANGICPSWHYHIVDVETLAAGALKLAPPWNFDTVLDLYGLKYDEADRHTALGDARLARSLYDAVMEAP